MKTQEVNSRKRVDCSGFDPHPGQGVGVGQNCSSVAGVTLADASCAESGKSDGAISLDLMLTPIDGAGSVSGELLPEKSRVTVSVASSCLAQGVLPCWEPM